MTEILYESKDVVVCVKQPGINSQGEGEDCLPQLLRRQLSVPEIYPVHRLDRAVGGLIAYAKNEKAAAFLSSALQTHTFEKEYLLVVYGRPDFDQAELRDLLFHDRNRNQTYVVARARKGVKEASLQAVRLATVTDGDGEKSLLRAALHTGRTHQIRVQFSSRGYPLLGDGKYGSREKCASVALWSYRLSFPRPGGGEKLTFSRLPPQSYPWSLFDAVLQ